MSRTTPAAVIESLGRNYDKKTPVTRFILQGGVLTDSLVTAATRQGSRVAALLTTEVLEAIECALACHFYSRHDPQFQSKTTGRASASFHGQTQLQLKSTLYGQDALTLDPTGCLMSMDNGGKPKMMWLGKPKSAQIDYVDRS